jgi:eukaryotic translation initiation factor 2C
MSNRGRGRGEGNRGGSRGRGRGEGKYEGNYKEKKDNKEEKEEKIFKNTDIKNIPMIFADDMKDDDKIPSKDFLYPGTPGEKGEKVKLVTNYFPITLPKGPFYQYGKKFFNKRC